MMISTILALLLHLAVVYIFARMEAWNDYMLIKNGHYINHVKAWIVRAIAVTVSMVVFVPMFGPFEQDRITGFTWMTVLGFCLMSAFGFSAVFRFRLNKERGLSPFYISPSNHYDGFFLGVANIGAVTDEEYDINGAGRLAYIIEAVLFASGLVMALSQII